MTDSDPHAVLGVAPGASLEEIRSAFRKAVMQRHPDTAGEASDDSSVRDLVDAYHELVDAAVRARHGTRDPKEIPVGRGPYPTDRARRSRDEGPPRVVSPCPRCQGSGAVRRVIDCPSCHGTGELTAVDVGRARVLRCRNCGGRGRVGTAHRCEACSGSGITDPG